MSKNERCYGIIYFFKRCKNPVNGTFYCQNHKFQLARILSYVLFTVAAGTLTIITFFINLDNSSQKRLSFEDVKNIVLNEENTEDYYTALDDLEDLSLLGDARAQNLLGLLFIDSIDRQKDGIRWLLKAARQGHVKAMYNLGRYFRYDTSMNDHNSYDSAAQWFLRAANEGDADAAIEIGLMYQEGLGVEKNVITSRQFFKRAEEAGRVYATYYLGISYSIYRPYDFSKALEKFQMSIDNGLAKAHRNIGLMYSRGEGVPVNQEVAYEEFFKAAVSGDVDAMVTVGDRLRTGNGVEKDVSKAIEWLRRAAARGNTQAYNLLGAAFLDKSYKGYDPTKAFENFKIGAERGNNNAKINLMISYCTGQGIEKNQKLCEYWKKQTNKNIEVQ